MVKIYGYNGYFYSKMLNKVYRDKNEIQSMNCANGRKLYKLKSSKGKWSTVSLNRIRAIAGDFIQLPSTVVRIHGTKYPTFIDRDSTIYSFNNFTYPRGTILKKSLKTKTGYPSVCIYYKDGKKTMDVHALMARSFIDPMYNKHGLCCMHKDNDKMNSNLENLSIGTYSQNNIDAYRTGANKGRGLKNKFY